MAFRMNPVRSNSGDNHANLVNLGYSESNALLARMLRPMLRGRHGATGYSFSLSLNRARRAADPDMRDALMNMDPGADAVRMAWLAQFLVNRAKSGDLKLALSYGEGRERLRDINDFLRVISRVSDTAEPGVDEFALYDADGTYTVDTYIGSFFFHE